jgi:hypothetical protein
MIDEEVNMYICTWREETGQQSFFFIPSLVILLLLDEDEAIHPI